MHACTDEQIIISLTHASTPVWIEYTMNVKQLAISCYCKTFSNVNQLYICRQIKLCAFENFTYLCSCNKVCMDNTVQSGKYIQCRSCVINLVWYHNMNTWISLYYSVFIYKTWLSCSSSYMLVGIIAYAFSFVTLSCPGIICGLVVIQLLYSYDTAEFG